MSEDARIVAWTHAVVKIKMRFVAKKVDATARESGAEYTLCIDVAAIGLRMISQWLRSRRTNFRTHACGIAI
jgi:hypothetical protein